MAVLSTVILIASAACQSVPLPGSTGLSSEISTKSSAAEPGLSLTNASNESPTSETSTTAALTTAATTPAATTAAATTTAAAPAPTTEPSAATSAVSTTVEVDPQMSPDGRSGAQLDTPYTVNGVILVNKKHYVSEKYVPVVTDESRPMDPEARAALTEMLNAAEAEGHYLSKNSGYRSYALQSEIFWSEANVIGAAAANKLTAYPGQSEHQTGLAVDLTDDNNGWAGFSDAFGELESGKWLVANSYKYGFILRYLKGKEAITGYLYEPWHFRYVGKEIADAIGPNPGITLEEYLGE